MSETQGIGINKNSGIQDEDMVLTDLLTPDEAAKILKVNVRTVTNLIRAGELKGVKVGRVWRIREEDLQAFIDQARGK